MNKEIKQLLLSVFELCLEIAGCAVLIIAAYWFFTCAPCVIYKGEW